MKIIITDAITGTSADSTLSGYPSSNAVDGHPKKQWKAAASALSATLTLTATGKVSGLAVFNIDADSVSLEMEDPNAMEWDDDATYGTGWDTDATYGTEWYYFNYDAAMVVHELQYRSHKSVWYEFDEIEAFSVDFNITVTTDEAGDDLGIGLAYLGKIEEFLNPKIGLSEGTYDYSIKKEMSNGARYVKNRDIVRTFSGSVQLARDYDPSGGMAAFPQPNGKYYIFMEEFARTVGANPAPWRITDIGDFNWVVFAAFLTPPQTVHSQLSHADVNFDIIEVL